MELVCKDNKVRPTAATSRTAASTMARVRFLARSSRMAGTRPAAERAADTPVIGKTGMSMAAAAAMRKYVQSGTLPVFGVTSGCMSCALPFRRSNKGPLLHVT